MSIIALQKRFIGFLSLCFMSIPALSANGHIYLSSSLAASFAELNKNTPVINYDSGLLMDAYPLKSTHASSAVFGFNGGYEFIPANHRIAIALGVGLYTNAADYNFDGQLVETASGDPSSTLYNYTYYINSTRLMAEIQLTWLMKKISPFIDFGVGPAWNRIGGYSESPATSNGYVALPPFQSNTNVNLAYQVGFGISTAGNFAVHHADFKQDRVSLGYRYVNLGSTSLGTRGAVYPFHLNTGSLTTNDVYLSYTHLF